MFNILKYSTDQLSGYTDLKIVFCLKQNGNFINDGGTFKTKDAADKWLYKLKKDYFILKLENFLIHKKHIIENSPGHKSINDKKETLNYLLYKYLYWAANQNNLTEACKWFINMYSKFEKILPGEKNKSLEGAKNELKELEKFASEQIKTFNSKL